MWRKAFSKVCRNFGAGSAGFRKTQVLMGLTHSMQLISCGIAEGNIEGRFYTLMMELIKKKWILFLPKVRIAYLHGTSRPQLENWRTWNEITNTKLIDYVVMMMLSPPPYIMMMNNAWAEAFCFINIFFFSHLSYIFSIEQERLIICWWIR